MVHCFRPLMVTASLLLAIALGTMSRPLFAQPSNTQASEPPDLVGETIRVGVKPVAPFVMVDAETNELSGFSIDLIREVGNGLDMKLEFVVHEELEEHLEAVSAGEVDLGIAATSVTSQREQELDFSAPYFDGGLGIATRRRSGRSRLWHAVFSREILATACGLAVFLGLCANLVWWTERGEPNSFDDRWSVGVGQALWWTIVTMTTVGYGDYVPRKSISRLVSIVVIVVGIVLFGFAVGVFSSALTLQKLQSEIGSVADLDGEKVAVVADTAGSQFMAKRRCELRTFDNLDDALRAVHKGRAVAVVYDVAVLRHHLASHDAALTLVGPTFDKHDYAIAFPLGSPLRKTVNVRLLRIMEGDPSRYDQLNRLWFE